MMLYFLDVKVLVIQNISRSSFKLLGEGNSQLRNPNRIVLNISVKDILR